VRSLTNKDIPSLLQQLKNHAAKWREIGIYLGFLPGELDNIGARPNLSPGAPGSWFGAMLESWIQWAPGDGRGSTSFATLEDLKDALSEAGLGASARGLTLQSIQTGELVHCSVELIFWWHFQTILGNINVNMTLGRRGVRAMTLILALSSSPGKTLP
jgi:hypothetical protein